MIERILLPLDGSPFAEAAAPLAFSLARRTGGTLHLLHVLEVPSFAVGRYPVDRSSGESYLTAVADRWDPTRGIEVRHSVREGLVAEELAQAATDFRADLVVMSTHGRGGMNRFWLGSVADRLVRAGSAPVLLVRPPESGSAPTEPFTTGRIVVPLDGSQRAEAALPWGKALARLLDAPVLLLEVLTFPGAPTLDTPEQGEIVEAAEREARALLQEHVRGLATEGAQASARVIRAPQAAQAILQQAGDDLIVTTTRGRGGVVRALLGSTADKVVRGAHGPVLVVPTD